MELKIVNGILKIQFTTAEKILSVHGSMEIPVSKITEVTRMLLDPTWKEIRMPGTNLPGIIKAGSYFTNRGKEFWYLTWGKEGLRIGLRDQTYKRIILGIDDSSFWIAKLANKQGTE